MHQKHGQWTNSLRTFFFFPALFQNSCARAQHKPPLSCTYSCSWVWMMRGELQYTCPPSSCPLPLHRSKDISVPKYCWHRIYVRGKSVLYTWCTRIQSKGQQFVSPALSGLWILALKLFYRNADPQAELAEISCASSSGRGNGYFFACLLSALNSLWSKSIISTYQLLKRSVHQHEQQLGGRRAFLCQLGWAKHSSSRGTSPSTPLHTTGHTVRAIADFSAYSSADKGRNPRSRSCRRSGAQPHQSDLHLIFCVLWGPRELEEGTAPVAGCAVLWNEGSGKGHVRVSHCLLSVLRTTQAITLF